MAKTPIILEAYCLKTKQREVMLNPVISKTSRGGYIAKGVDAAGNKLNLIMSSANAEAAIASGIKSEGL